MRETLAFAALLCGTICLNSQPALADNGVVRIPKRHLDHATWNQSPLELQIIDDTPRLKDCRTAEDSKTYEVHIGPMPTSAASEPIIISTGGPNGSGGLPQGGSPGTIRISTGRLPASRFDSNIPASGPMSRSGLPDGSTTNRLANKAFLHGSMLNPSVAKPTAAFAAKPTSATAPQSKVETYTDPIASASGFSSSTTTGVVHGSMLAKTPSHQ